MRFNARAAGLLGRAGGIPGAPVFARRRQNVASGGGAANPPPILANLAAYHDIVDSVFDESDAAGRAKSVSDLSGNARPLLQATAANQPAIVGKNTAAGYLSFNGTAYKMDVSGLALAAQPFTIYYIGSYEGWVLNNTILINTAGNCGLIERVASPRVDVYAGTGLALTTWASAEQAIVTCVFNGASSEVRKNADASTAGAAGAGVMDVVKVCYFGTQFVAARIRALLFYTGAHSTAEQNQIITWANSKFTLF